jgi:predicted MFS family arabinose efflux permease
MIDHIAWAAVFAVVAVLAVIGWFWFRRAMAELVDARKEMKREVESLRDLLHTHRKE